MIEAPAFTYEIAMVFVVVGVTIFLFLAEWLRVDVVAILVMVSLPLLGLVDGKETFAGLSSTAVVSIIAVIIMGRGLDHTGLVNSVVRPLIRLAGSSQRRIVLLLSITVSIISSFMQNVGAAALFLPAIQRMSRVTGQPISQLLMPVGFSAILGGTVTLVGSSPLIMLNDLMQPYGLASFDLFSVTPAGLALVVMGMLYFLVVGKILLPTRKAEPAATAEDGDPLPYYPELGELHELTFPATKRQNEDGNELCDLQEIQVKDLVDRYNVHVIGLVRTNGHSNGKMLPPGRTTRITPGSTLAAYATQKELDSLARELGIHAKDRLDVFAKDLTDDLAGLVEAVVPPHSEFVGKSLRDIRFRHQHLMTPMTVSRGGESHYEDVPDWVLQPGDVILIHGSWNSFHRMRPKRKLLFAQSLDTDVLHPEKARSALACFLVAIGLVAFTSLPISVCLMAGALGMILTGVLSIDEAYRGVDWRTVFLLAGLIPLGVAMQKTDAAKWLAYHLLDVVGSPSPLVFYFIVGLIATAFTLVVSNVGATVLLVPLVIGMAQNIGADPRMAALVVGMAASNSFLLPTHQVNALYMGPGSYTSKDFVKAGAPLSILFLLVLSAMLHYFY